MLPLFPAGIGSFAQHRVGIDVMCQSPCLRLVITLGLGGKKRTDQEVREYRMLGEGRYGTKVGGLGLRCMELGQGRWG